MNLVIRTLCVFGLLASNLSYAVEGLTRGEKLVCEATATKAYTSFPEGDDVDTRPWRISIAKKEGFGIEKARENYTDEQQNTDSKAAVALKVEKRVEANLIDASGRITLHFDDAYEIRVGVHFLPQILYGLPNELGKQDQLGTLNVTAALIKQDDRDARGFSILGTAKSASLPLATVKTLEFPLFATSLVIPSLAATNAITLARHSGLEVDEDRPPGKLLIEKGFLKDRELISVNLMCWLKWNDKLLPEETK